MNVKEITLRLYAISNAILEKTGATAGITPYLRVEDDICQVPLYCVRGSDHYYKIGDAKGETPEAALDAADRIIAALPDMKDAKLHDHMARVADCIDKATADAIPDEYVTHLRMAVQAMTENLLTGPVTA